MAVVESIIFKELTLTFKVFSNSTCPIKDVELVPGSYYFVQLSFLRSGGLKLSNNFSCFVKW